MGGLLKTLMKKQEKEIAFLRARESVATRYSFFFKCHIDLLGYLLTP